ncbi:hypothetical protein VTO42DRAFT_1828 [Malbranchea cinnamomea]
MFAVPGWSVSAAELKAQEQPTTAKSHETQDKQNEDGAEKKGKKRKRGKDKNAVKITKSNLDEMWKKHIEGNAGSSTAAQRENNANKRRKTEKDNNDGTANTGLKAKDRDPTETKDSNDTPNPAEKLQKTNNNKKKKKKKEQKESKQDDRKDSSTADAATAALPEALPPPPPSSTTALTPLQKAMRQKLLSARFRHLNETLYTTPSDRAMELFNANPELFHEYHAGFSQQVKESWPSNPVDSYIQAVKSRGALKQNAKHDKSNPALVPLPRRPHGTCTIADLGCGDARFAKALMPLSKSLNLKLLSFDLCATDPLVTKADIANLPVEDGSVDVAIFCLSLMGTNWVSFVEEAWRVLRGDGKGECWISEVKSRFGKVPRTAKPPAAAGKMKKNKNKKRKNPADDDAADDLNEEEIFAEDVRAPSDGNETDISAFVEVLRTRGFVLKQESVDKSNKMFVKMEFVKTRNMPPTRGKYATKSNGLKVGKRFLESDDGGSGLTPEEESKVLKPCVYKTR